MVLLHFLKQKKKKTNKFKTLNPGLILIMKKVTNKKMKSL